MRRGSQIKTTSSLLGSFATAATDSVCLFPQPLRDRRIGGRGAAADANGQLVVHQAGRVIPFFLLAVLEAEQVPHLVRQCGQQVDLSGGGGARVGGPLVLPVAMKIVVRRVEIPAVTGRVGI